MLDFSPVFFEDGELVIVDQTLLPGREEYIVLRNKEDVSEAIKKLKVRGAPAIGITAAYGLFIATREFRDENMNAFRQHVEKVADFLESARPTAVNLSWAIGRMKKALDTFIEGGKSSRRDGIRNVTRAKEVLFYEAEKLRREDEAACYAMGEYGMSLLLPGMGVLTHCNAGALAASKYGTALSPIYLAQDKGYGLKVYVDETRPLLQGSRLTAWELQKAGINVTLICDNMAASVMKKGWVEAVLVGCDRMAANGDGANKIGTSALAILAKEYGVPFYMFVPTSTIDLDTAKGDDIEIEERKGREICELWFERDMAPKGTKTFNPAFDITDSKYITAIITELGIVRPPYKENLKKIMEKKEALEREKAEVEETKDGLFDSN